ncbi:MAG: tetratricopeptide repeat protein [Opitutaceae bacterium]
MSMAKRFGWVAGFGAVLLLVLSGWWWWRGIAEENGVIAASIPEQPDLAAWPSLFVKRLSTSEERARSGPDRLRGLAELSRLYHANGFYEEAVACYTGLLRVDPGNAVWPHRLAFLLAESGRLEEALALWRMTVAIAPDFPPARIRLGDALLKMNRWAEAAEVYQAALDRDETQAHAQLGLARVDFEHGDWEAARIRLEEAGRLSGQRIGRDLLPTVLEALGDEDEAAAIRGEAKAFGAYSDIRDPWLEELFEDCYDTYRLAVAAGDAGHAGDNPMAIHRLERALRLDPENYQLQYQLGMLYVAMGDLNRARGLFESCTVIAPEFPDGWAQLEVLQRKAGQNAAADLTLTRGLQHCPDSPGLHLANGRRLVELGRKDEAIGELQESIRLRPQEANAYFDLARIHFEREEVEAGMELIRAALVAEPDFPVGLVLMVNYSINNGDEAAARDWLARARHQSRITPEELEGMRSAYATRFGRQPW